MGAGWSQTEFEGYSHWDPPGTRVDKTREGLELILQLWEKPTVDFDGKFYQAKGAVLDPKPVQKPHPPLLFGGVGRRMLQLAGQYGDICYIPPWVQMDYEKAKMIVKQEARRFGRENEVAFATGSPRPQEKFDLKAMGEEVEKARRGGAEYYLASFPRDSYEEDLRRFGKQIISSY